MKFPASILFEFSCLNLYRLYAFRGIHFGYFFVGSVWSRVRPDPIIRTMLRHFALPEVNAAYIYYLRTRLYHPKRITL